MDRVIRDRLREGVRASELRAADVGPVACAVAEGADPPAADAA